MEDAVCEAPGRWAYAYAYSLAGRPRRDVAAPPAPTAAGKGDRERAPADPTRSGRAVKWSVGGTGSSRTSMPYEPGGREGKGKGPPEPVPAAAVPNVAGPWGQWRELSCMVLSVYRATFPSQSTICASTDDCKDG